MVEGETSGERVTERLRFPRPLGTRLLPVERQDPFEVVPGSLPRSMQRWISRKRRGPLDLSIAAL
jgi:hypothetical protein